MKEQKRFTVSSAETAASMLDYFNGFHDGFMKRIAITSQDRIEEDLSQTCTGVFDVEIDFAHYNYADGANPFHGHKQIVRAQFRNVRDIVADFSDGFLGNTIISLSIAQEKRILGLRLGRHYYLETERRYELREHQLFTFTDATFVEQ